MGADQQIDWRAAAASALDWWQDAGVDTLVEDIPHDWFAAPERPLPIAPPPVSGPQHTAAPAPVAEPAAMPDTLAAFLEWRAGPAAPEAAWRGASILASGPADAAIMIFVDCPDRDDDAGGVLMAGQVGRLFDRMLAAIGLDRSMVHLAAVCARRPVAGRMPREIEARFAEIARHHVALVAPKRLLLMGNAASRAILGAESVGVRGRLHGFNHKGGETQVVASFHPRFLIEKPAAKAEAWKDLQLLMGGIVRVIRKLAFVLAIAALPLPALAAPVPADATPPEPAADPTLAALAAKADQIPEQLDAGQRDAYRAVFQAIRAGKWTDAQIGLATMKPGPLHAIARAELFTAKGSPKVELDPLVQLLNEAPELPEAETLTRLATSRGATALPPLPVAQRLIWQDGAPRRVRAKSVKSDLIAADLAARMQPLVKADMGAAAQAMLEATDGLSPEALTEWQARVSWMYFLAGDDANARAMGAKAGDGAGDWAIQGRWTGALSAWRQNDCATSEIAFEGVAARAGDVDLRAAALYWAARADMACGRPDKIQPRLQAAAQFSESFYGQLARQALAVKDKARPSRAVVAADWAAIDKRPNVRVAAALVEVGETDLAESVIRQQARIGDPREFASLARVAAALSLPATTVWLAHNCPQGITAAAEARYPTPNWTPDSGWRVDKSLVYAHTLEESGFRNRVVSPAGAYGLMQIMPAAATDFARERGLGPMDRSALTKPSTNMDIGQRHLERLRDMAGITGGLLPKVIAAYNAGPKPVGEWNAIIHDGGDPLLYIESIPYWETRGYVTTVLRNYWMYEAQNGKKASSSRSALAQGMWPRFPGLPGAKAVRMNARPNGAASASAIAVSAPVGAKSTIVSAD